MHVREEFFCKQGVGPVFFPIVKGGDQYFFTHAKGGPEKIDDRPSQIDGPPLPLENDSSLRNCFCHSNHLSHLVIVITWLIVGDKYFE